MSVDGVTGGGTTSYAYAVTNANSSVTSANSALNAAEQRLSTARENLELARTQATSTQEEITAAEQRVTEAEQARDQLQTQVEEAGTQVETLTTEAETAAEAVTTAEDQLETATEQLETLRTEREDINSQLTSARQAKTEADQQLTEATTRVTEATTARQQAQEALTTAQGNTEQARTALETARTQEQAAIDAWEQAQQATEDARTAVETAQTRVETAQGRVDTLTTQRDSLTTQLATARDTKTQADAALQTANERVTTATTDLQTKETAYADAQQLTATRRTELTTAQTNETNARNAYETAQATTRQRTTELTNAENALTQATANVAQKEGAVATAQNRVNSAQGRVDRAQNELAAAEAALRRNPDDPAAKARVSRARAALSSARSELSSAQAALRAAEEALRQAREAERRAREAVEAARRAKEEAERAEEQARIAMEAAIQAREQAEQALRDAEEAEQQALEAVEAARTELEEATQAQAEAQEAAEEAATAVTELEEQLAQVEEDLAAAQEELTAAQEELTAAEEALTAAEEAEEAALTAKEDAIEARETAETELEEAEEAEEAAQEDLETAETELEEAEEAKTEAQEAVEEAETEVTELEETLADLDTQITEAETAKTEAQTALEEARTAKTEKDEALREARERKTELEAQLREKDTALTEAREAKTQAQTRKTEADERVTTAQAAVDQAQEAVDQARENVTQAQQRLEAAQADAREAEEAELAARTEAEKARVQGENIDAELAAMTPAEREQLLRDQEALEAQESEVRPPRPPSDNATDSQMMRYAQQRQQYDSSIHDIRQTYFDQQGHEIWIDADGTAYRASLDTAGNIELEREDPQPATPQSPPATVRNTATIRTDRSRTSTTQVRSVPTADTRDIEQTVTQTVHTNPAGQETGSARRIDQETTDAQGTAQTASVEEDFDANRRLTTRTIETTSDSVSGPDEQTSDVTNFRPDGTRIDQLQTSRTTQPNGDIENREVTSTFRADDTTARVVDVTSGTRGGVDHSRTVDNEYAANGIDLAHQVITEAGEDQPTVVSDTEFTDGVADSTYISRDGDLPTGMPPTEYVEYNADGSLRLHIAGGPDVGRGNFTATVARDWQQPGFEYGDGGPELGDLTEMQIQWLDPDSPIPPGHRAAIEYTRGDNNRFSANPMDALLGPVLQPGRETPSAFDVPAALQTRAIAANVDAIAPEPGTDEYRELLDEQAALDRRLDRATTDEERAQIQREYFSTHQVWIDLGEDGQQTPVAMASTYVQGLPPSDIFGSERAEDPHVAMARTGISGTSQAGNPQTTDILRNIYADLSTDEIVHIEERGRGGAGSETFIGEHRDSDGTLTERDIHSTSTQLRTEQGLEPLTVTEVSQERFNGTTGNKEGEQYSATATSDSTMTSLREQVDIYGADGIIDSTEIDDVTQSRDWSQSTVDAFVDNNEAAMALAHDDDWDVNDDQTDITVPPVGSFRSSSETDISYDAQGRPVHETVHEVNQAVQATTDEEYDDEGNLVSQSVDANGAKLTTVTTDRERGSEGGTTPIYDEQGRPLVPQDVTTNIRTVAFDPDDGQAGGNNGREHQWREITEVTTGSTVAVDGTTTLNWVTPMTTRVLQEGFDDDWMYEQQVLKTELHDGSFRIATDDDGKPIKLEEGDSYTDRDGNQQTFDHDPSEKHWRLDAADHFESFMEEWGSKIVMVGTIAAGVALAFTGVGSAAGLALIGVGLTLSSTQLAYTALNYSQGEASGWDLALDAVGVAGFAVSGIQGARLITQGTRGLGAASNAARAGSAAVSQADDVARLGMGARFWNSARAGVSARVASVADDPLNAVHLLGDAGDVYDGSQAIKAAMNGDWTQAMLFAGALGANRIAARMGVDWRENHSLVSTGLDVADTFGGGAPDVTSTVPTITTVDTTPGSTTIPLGGPNSSTTGDALRPGGTGNGAGTNGTTDVVRPDRIDRGTGSNGANGAPDTDVGGARGDGASDVSESGVRGGGPALDAPTSRVPDVPAGVDPAPRLDLQTDVAGASSPDVDAQLAAAGFPDAGDYVAVRDNLVAAGVKDMGSVLLPDGDGTITGQIVNATADGSSVLLRVYDPAAESFSLRAYDTQAIVAMQGTTIATPARATGVASLSDPEGIARIEDAMRTGEPIPGSRRVLKPWSSGPSGDAVVVETLLLSDGTTMDVVRKTANSRSTQEQAAWELAKAMGIDAYLPAVVRLENGDILRQYIDGSERAITSSQDVLDAAVANVRARHPELSEAEAVRMAQTDLELLAYHSWLLGDHDHQAGLSNQFVRNSMADANGALRSFDYGEASFVPGASGVDMPPLSLEARQRLAATATEARIADALGSVATVDVGAHPLTRAGDERIADGSFQREVISHIASQTAGIPSTPELGGATIGSPDLVDDVPRPYGRRSARDAGAMLEPPIPREREVIGGLRVGADAAVANPSLLVGQEVAIPDQFTADPRFAWRITSANPDGTVNMTRTTDRGSSLQDIVRLNPDIVARLGGADAVLANPTLLINQPLRLQRSSGAIQENWRFIGTRPDGMPMFRNVETQSLRATDVVAHMGGRTIDIGASIAHRQLADSSFDGRAALADVLRANPSLLDDRPLRLRRSDQSIEAGRAAHNIDDGWSIVSRTVDANGNPVFTLAKSYWFDSLSPKARADAEARGFRSGDVVPYLREGITLNEILDFNRARIEGDHGQLPRLNVFDGAQPGAPQIGVGRNLQAGPSQAVADQAVVHAQAALDYMYSRYGYRPSGGELNIIINDPTAHNNASMQSRGNVLRIGTNDGNAAAFDPSVIMHELGHKMVDDLTRGEYGRVQAGSIHEGIADVMAAAWTHDPIIGRTFGRDGQVIRDIREGTRLIGTRQEWEAAAARDAERGVEAHTGSGVISGPASRIADTVIGRTPDGRDITIGWTEVGDLFHQALRSGGMSQRMDFDTFSDSVRTAAAHRYGVEDARYEAVVRALDEAGLVARPPIGAEVARLTTRGTVEGGWRVLGYDNQTGRPILQHTDGTQLRPPIGRVLNARGVGMQLDASGRPLFDHVGRGTSEIPHPAAGVDAADVPRMARPEPVPGDLTAGFQDIANADARVPFADAPEFRLEPPSVARQELDLEISRAVTAQRSADVSEYIARLDADGGSVAWMDMFARWDAAHPGGPSARALWDAAFARALPELKAAQQSVGRTRPYHLDPTIEMIGGPQDSFGFPSGHTAGAYLGATIMSTLDPANASSYMALAQDVARSRVASGHHFATDTTAGARLGYEAVAPLLRAAGFTPPALELPRVLDAADFAGFGDVDLLTPLTGTARPRTDLDGPAGDAETGVAELQPLGDQADLVSERFGDALSPEDIEFARIFAFRHVLDGDEFGGIHLAPNAHLTDAGFVRLANGTTIDLSPSGKNRPRADRTFQSREIRDANGNVLKPGSTMWPPNWTEADVIRFSRRAHERAVAEGSYQSRDGVPYLIARVRVDGLDVELHRNPANGEVLTAFPARNGQSVVPE